MKSIVAGAGPSGGGPSLPERFSRSPSATSSGSEAVAAACADWEARLRASQARAEALLSRGRGAP